MKNQEKEIRKIRERLSELIGVLYREDSSNRKKSQWLIDELGITASTLSRIINGIQPIKDDLIVRLLNIDDRINIQWIYTGYGEMFVDDNNKEKIIDLLSVYLDKYSK